MINKFLQEQPPGSITTDMLSDLFTTKDLSDFWGMRDMKNSEKGTNMNMQYTINEWCATCGKAKRYTGVFSNDGQTTTPEMCKCIDSVPIRPINSAPPLQVVQFPHMTKEQVDAIRINFGDSQAKIIPSLINIAPESMEVLEQMTRRVVAEEVSKAFNGMTQALVESAGEDE